MSLQKLYIKNKSYLSYKHNLISVKIDDYETTVCFDDIDTIIIENQQSTITSALLSQLSKADINVIFCDEKFMPSSILQGINKNSRTTKIQKAQIEVSKPKLNQIWKNIIIHKVNNQSKVLKKLHKNSDYLDSLISRITSNDKENIEATAAAYYFKELFGKEFSRNDPENINNAILNFGYAIFRSSICRYLVAYGLNPAFGIHHSSELNAFNLADDLIEPFRPIVDDYVVRNIKKEMELNSKIKIDLLKLLDKTVIYDSKNVTVSNCMKAIVANYQSICLLKCEELTLFEL
ncbi:type II CRISPR-associated endonuclease Cas1 [Halarcobacter ebronensis]|uniref:CRISPR-associated endonuclease Cas1 n=1 Tax=Halarcobacter ebronensis TaxID=1462615 RepID=A0A4Q1AJU7_9BACT|nr:type II CRISPR-associated endonuclease Cas1 [Halarcobacter ebronensis]QKF82642.1 CRISPR/Cas system-associated endonuclease Cas1, type II-C [Halarcobacter ebronensis]RXK02065.1 subtype II CRISPR-associated endonuclease Cas1 [Halarcobacter ebronensis]